MRILTPAPLIPANQATPTIDPDALLRLINQECAERRLHEFVQQAWPVLSPTIPFVDNWHIQAICEHLEAVTRCQIRRLVINVPPGFSKSSLVCVFWPCWVWLRDPASRWLVNSYSGGFARRDSMKCRDLIGSDWFQANWGDRFKIRADQDTQVRFSNDRGGFRLASFVGGVTGERGDYILADDPHNISEADSKAMRESVLKWWDEVMSGRAANPSTSRYVVIMQRLHQADLCGHLAKQGGYEHLVIPMEFETHRRCVTSIWQDPRTDEGELAWPAYFTPEAVADWKKRLGAYGYAGQLQQNPSPEGAGGIFDRANFRYFTIEDAQGPSRDGGTLFQRWLVLDHGDRYERVRVAECKWFQTVDTAMKTGQDSDYSVVATWALTPSGKLCLYNVLRERVAMPLQYAFVRNARSRCPYQLLFQAVEDKVSGTGIIQEGVLRGTPFKALKADGDKRRRAADIATRYANHMVFHLAGAPWLADAENELCTFDRGAHDDVVDTCAYAGLLATSDALLRIEDDSPGVLWPRPEDLEDMQPERFSVNWRGETFTFEDYADIDAFYGRKPGKQWWEA